MNHELPHVQAGFRKCRGTRDQTANIGCIIEKQEFQENIFFWLIDYAIAAFRTVVLEKTLESPLDCEEIQPVHPKGDQSWVFFGRTDAEAEPPILLPPDAKSWLTGKDPNAGKDWGQEEKGTTEEEMVRLHHQLNGHEFE